MDEILWEIFGLIYYFCYKSRYKQGETANSDEANRNSIVNNGYQLQAMDS